MKRLIFKQRSKDDLLGIFDYIASDSPMLPRIS
jgi:hypothetical protein